MLLRSARSSFLAVLFLIAGVAAQERAAVIGPRAVVLNPPTVSTPQPMPTQVIGTTSAPLVYTYNAGNYATSQTITSITLTGSSASEYAIVGGTCFVGAQITTNGTCTINVTFTPTGTGFRLATLTVGDTPACFTASCPTVAQMNATGLNPAPVLNSISPQFAVVNTGMTVRVNGTNFVNGSVVNWNGQPRATQFSSSTLLTALLLASDFPAAGTGNVSVTTTGTINGSSTTSPLPITIVRSLTDNPATAPPVADSRQALQTDSSSSPPATVTPTCGSHSNAHGAWMRFTAPVTGNFTMDTTGSAFQTLVSLWTGNPNSLTQAACAEASVHIARSTGLRTIIQPKPSAPVTAGTDIWALVTATNGDGGPLRMAPGFVAGSPVPGATFSTMMPHIVAGGGYVTKLTLVNLSGASNNISVNFVDDAGNVITSVTRMLQAGETMRVASDESARFGPFAIFWASISAQGRVSANLFYEIADGGGNIVNTVGFNDDSGNTTFTIPVELQANTQTGDITHTVGLALSNPNNVQVQVSLALRDTSGFPRGTSTINIPPYGHTQLSLNSAFQGQIPGTNFIGVVTGSTTPAVGVNVVALGDDFGPFFSTPPLTGGTRVVVPHIFTGSFNGGYVTNLTLVNHTLSSNAVTVNYFDSSGLQVGSTPYNIPAGAALRVPGNEAGRFGAATERWAVVTGAGNFSVNSFFEVQDNPTNHRVVNTIGFNNPPELTDFTIPVELEPASAQNNNRDRTIGIAFANANGSTANVTLTLLNADGTTLGTSQKTINANSQLLLSLTSEFQLSLPGGNFIGALVVHSNVPVAAVALQADQGPFSSVPVVNGHP